ncbi:uncharacterized protein K444DRAFT_15715 [Hyaloscypha bicolor E]|uniref:Uncharacterized protein n=1 Tax=Hyaloscypha bicolor E TaxID=1095630 RepID=A0A2J6TWQ7_9HELO|nr:uncharacterized protein K444DRAFT_15715 [Hyaloscypha bicolor E]PMD67435.1 hypothetical protein K444DRAFT_15715 [Hyaloscypha bicolor E]
MLSLCLLTIFTLVSPTNINHHDSQAISSKKTTRLVSQASLWQFSSLISIRKESTIHFLDTMATCGHEECFVATPPTLAFMLENFPVVTLDPTIDHSIPRCRLCDLIAARARETAAVYPPPTYSSAIERLQNHIASTEQMIGEGIRKEELEATLPSMKQMLADEIWATELRMLEAWKGHWAIWGHGEGPEMPDEYVLVEEEEPENVVEEKPKSFAGRKRKAPMNIKGRALAKKAKRA